MKIKVEGLRELEKALSELPKATGKNVLRRVAKGALEPMADNARSKAPDDPRTGAPDLRTSIIVSEKRTGRSKKRVKRVKGKFRSDPSTGIEMAMGPSTGGGVLNYATFQEFGTVKMAANPYMRPAWDSGAQAALDYVIENLSREIDRAAARLAKKRAKG